MINTKYVWALSFARSLLAAVLMRTACVSKGHDAILKPATSVTLRCQEVFSWEGSAHKVQKKMKMCIMNMLRVEWRCFLHS